MTRAERVWFIVTGYFCGACGAVAGVSMIIRDPKSVGWLLAAEGVALCVLLLFKRVRARL